jgi:hypothetical protein
MPFIKMQNCDPRPTCGRKQVKWTVTMIKLIPTAFLIIWGFLSPLSAQQIFPTVTSEDLNGRSVTLPSELPGDPTIVFIAYKQNQQPMVNTWINSLGLDPDIGPEFIEVPVVGVAALLFRSVVDNGMRSGITDTSMRARTITLYENPRLVNDPLGFSGRDTIRVLLVRNDGEVIWSTSGPATQAGLNALSQAYNNS